MNKQAKYKVKVFGESCVVIGSDEQGNYFLNKNRKLELRPFRQESFHALTLRAVSKLTFTDGKWLLDGRDIKSRWLDPLVKAQGRKDLTVEGHTEIETIGSLIAELNRLRDDAIFKIKGVVWFQERSAEPIPGETIEECRGRQRFYNENFGKDTFGPVLPLAAAQVFVPVLLTDWVVSRKQRKKLQGNPSPQPKARFQQNYSFVEVRGESGFALSESLSKLIQRIMQNDGHCSRKKLLEGQTDSYQPEKVLNSGPAKRLQKLGLVGYVRRQKRHGRESHFWAKAEVK